MKFLGLHIILLLFVQQPLNEGFTQANELYQNGKFVEAIELYKGYANDEINSPEVYFNLGSAYYKIDSLAQSIYYFEKAKTISPNDMALQHNLALAYGQQSDDIDKFPELFFISWLKKIATLLSTNIWLITGIILFWLSLLLFYLNGKNKSFLFTKKRWAIPLVAGLFCVLFSWANYHYQSSVQSAIVMHKEVSIKNKPNATASNLLKIHSGLKVDVLDTVDDWHQIKLSDGTEGWLSKKSIKLL